mgnify:CR=1 FL=1
MVPTFVVELSEIPTTPNGKVDQKTLLTMDFSEFRPTQYVAPENETEEKLVAIWEEALNLRQLGIQDDFFQIGGDSIVAIKVINQVSKAFDFDETLEGLLDKFEADIKAKYKELAAQHAARQAEKVILPWSEAKANKLELNWDSYTPPVPAQVGIEVFEDFDLQILKEYIDWTPFFATWELRGKYPNIFEDEYVGDEAKKLFADATAMLDDIISNKKLKANAVIGIFEANEENGDVLLSNGTKFNA